MSRRRVKNITYDEDEFYGYDDDYYDDGESSLSYSKGKKKDAGKNEKTKTGNGRITGNSSNDSCVANSNKSNAFPAKNTKTQTVKNKGDQTKNNVLKVNANTSGSVSSSPSPSTFSSRFSTDSSATIAEVPCEDSRTKGNSNVKLNKGKNGNNNEKREYGEENEEKQLNWERQKKEEKNCNSNEQTTSERIRLAEEEFLGGGGFNSIKSNVSNDYYKNNNNENKNNSSSLYENSNVDDPNEDNKSYLNLAIIGHVDAGKSTLMGHLLYMLNMVSKKEIRKYEKESKEMGKSSFMYAWVLDEGADERQRGITVDVCVKHFYTKTKHVVVLDAPGHYEYIPMMLSAAMQADAALLVVDVARFSVGMEKGGQTKEHIQLVRSLGINHLIVAINKMDSVQYSQQEFIDVKEKLHNFFVGAEGCFKAENITYVPLSAFQGVNIINNECDLLKEWYGKGPTLLMAIDQLNCNASGGGGGGSNDGISAEKKQGKNCKSSGNFKACVSDLYKTASAAHASVKVVGGELKVGDEVYVLPSKVKCTCKSIRKWAQPHTKCCAGEYVDDLCLDIENEFINIGSVLCTYRNPLPVVNNVACKILMFDSDIPFVIGMQVMIYVHTCVCDAVLTKIECTYNKQTGEKISTKSQRALFKGSLALVRLRIPNGVHICCEKSPLDIAGRREAGEKQWEGEGGGTGGKSTTLSRIILRNKGKTLAAGQIVDA